MSKPNYRIPQPQRLRRITPSFARIDHRLVHNGYLGVTTKAMTTCRQSPRPSRLAGLAATCEGVVTVYGAPTNTPLPVAVASVKWSANQADAGRRRRTGKRTIPHAACPTCRPWQIKNLPQLVHTVRVLPIFYSSRRRIGPGDSENAVFRHSARSVVPQHDMITCISLDFIGVIRR